MHDSLTALATGRASSMFTSDMESRSAELHDRLDGSRVLVVGGAGSIGGAATRLLVQYRLRALHIVDQNENGLAELVRDLRSGRRMAAESVRADPIDTGSPVMLRLLRNEAPFDIVLNFAALKHVRSEKSVPSLLQMLETNVLKARRMMYWLTETGSQNRYFCVSTDKAANPVNLMGASKRIMERLIFAGGDAERAFTHVTSARFANVAFSSGSLLESFLMRLQKRQPIAVPRDTRRYFVSLQESGEICLLAAVCGPDGHIIVPRLDAEADLVPLETVARAVLKQQGYEPQIFEDEETVRAAAAAGPGPQAYPLLLTPLDTEGEKPYEEFVGTDEHAAELGFDALLGIRSASVDPSSVDSFIRRVESAIENADLDLTKQDIITWIRDLVPELAHRDTGLSLDNRI